MDVFVLISGYFLIESKVRAFHFQRILKFWGQVFFYSVVFFVVFALFDHHDFGIKSLIDVFFPITRSTWWFASTYFVLYLLHPFLNKLLHSLDQTLYQSLLVLGVICWCLIPTFTTSSYQGNALLWFITLYAAAGYAKLYGFNKKFTAKHYFLFFGIFFALTYLSSVVFTILGAKWDFFATKTTYFYGQEKAPVFLTALTLFLAFTKLKLRYHKWINVIASATFGVYLIHDNGYVRPFLWKQVFHNAAYQDSVWLIPYSILVVIFVYCVCTLLELIRQWTIDRPYRALVDRYADTWQKPFETICQFFRDIVFGKDK